MPTYLPRPPRVAAKPSRLRTVINVLFNTFMVVSALLLAFVVLVREEQYALGRPDAATDAFEQAATLGITADGEQSPLPPD